VSSIILQPVGCENCKYAERLSQNRNFFRTPNSDDAAEFQYIIWFSYDLLSELIICFGIQQRIRAQALSKATSERVSRVNVSDFFPSSVHFSYWPQLMLRNITFVCVFWNGIARTLCAVVRSWISVHFLIKTQFQVSCVLETA
jgi:hypothetical protein